MRHDPVWHDLRDKELDGWLTHCRRILPRMDRWIVKYEMRFDGDDPRDRFVRAMYGELANLSIEAKARLARRVT